MAQSEDSIKSQTKSPNSHLPHVSGPDNSISSFDLLNSYRSAAMFLKAAADSQNPRNKSMNLPPGVVKSRYSSTSEDSVAAAAAAAAAASLIPSRQHSPSASSKFQAALAMAMAASSSPPSTCPSSSSSGHQGEHPVATAATVNEFRSSDNTQSSSLGAFFRPPHASSVTYETVDGPPGAGGGNGPNDLGFQPPSLPPNPSNSGGLTNSLPPFVGSGGQSDIPSASTCLTNAMLLPASIVNVLGQQMQSNHYHQPQSPAYLSTINTNSGGGSFSQQQQQATQGGPNQGGNEAGPPSLFPQTGGLSQQQPGPHPTHSIQSAASSADTSRYSNPGGRSTSSAALHDDSNNKREQRLLKNREAARECRRKKKEYVRCLERQVNILQDQNRQLIEELQKMKALCAGAFLDPSSQQMTLQPPPLDRRNDPGSGMDFVDSASAATSNPHHHHSHPHLRKPPLSSLLSPQAPSDVAGGSNSNSFNPPGEMEVDSTSRSNELTLLKSSVSQNRQQLLLLHGLSAMKDGGVRKSEEGDYSMPGSGTSTWMSSLPEQKSKFADDEMDTRPPSSSPHIHPVKRVLKRFGNEQHRLSQQKAQQEAQQQVGTAGKPDPDKVG
ncbi:unnamed protein product [Hymenolepis diminuta]|uniref:BZIP domain-containing protein n=1 Tax=Hymenolepis diminuta TaxID=6216 RepID=A0A564YK89_HYMDI|nr:unnamed protein product [Hymenolepis diminuta]